MLRLFRIIITLFNNYVLYKGDKMQKTNKEKSLVPSSYEIDLAKESRKQLSTILQKNKKNGIEISIKLDDKLVSFILSPMVIALLNKALVEIENGNIVTVNSEDSEITTQEAANLLNVSRPYVIKILDEGLIDFRKVGSHRRIKLADLIKYKNKMERKNRRAIEELISEAQELKMGY